MTQTESALKVAKGIVDGIVDGIVIDLTDHRGLSSAWYDMDEETQDDIRKEWVSIIISRLEPLITDQVREAELKRTEKAKND